MKKPLLLVAAFTLAVHASFNASAQTLLAESFNGLTTGTNLAGQNSWIKGGTGPDVTVENTAPLNGNFAYVQMPAGNGSTSRVYKSFTTTSAGTNTFYYTFLLNLSATSTSSSGYFMSLGDPNPGTGYFARVFAQTSGSGYVLGASKISTTPSYGTTVLSYGTTYRVVVRYSFVTSTNNDETYLWIDPALNSTEPATSAAEVAITTGSDASLSGGNVGSVMWHNRSTANPTGKFDALTVAVGTTSASAWSSLLFGIPLPVSITSVTASRKAAGIQIAWDAAEESNIRHYEVERSADGRSFAPAALVAATGNANSSLQYSWLDQQPGEGTGYYRIKVVELNGTTSYSRTVTATAAGEKDARLTLSPNPAQGPAVTLAINVPEAGTYAMEVFNAAGQKIRSEELQLGIGATTRSLELTGAAPGLYTVRLTGQSVDLHQSLVVGTK